MTELTTTNGAIDVIERVIMAGDLARLQPAERVSYYIQTCKSLNLNPLTRPFEFITLNGKLVMYATRNCTDQLRSRQQVSVQITARERMDDIYVVTARASTPDGRADESIGAVPIGGLRGEALANALMKAETKAKRRATLSIVGLSFSDETEIEAIPGAQRVTVNTDTGEIMDAPAPVYTAPSSDLASDKQIGLIKGLTRKGGWDEAGVLEWAAPVVGSVLSFAHLTKRQASDLITALKEAEVAPPGDAPEGAVPAPF